MSISKNTIPKKIREIKTSPIRVASNTLNEIPNTTIKVTTIYFLSSSVDR